MSWFRRLVFRKEPPKPAPPPPPKFPRITVELLTQLGWSHTQHFAPIMAAALPAYEIHTISRVADFLGQVAVESGKGRFRKEIWGPTPAQIRYEGRKSLGNVLPGDGKRFMGRGLIQITGRANYEEAKHWLKPTLDLDGFSRWLETFDGAAVSACWWWKHNGCNQLSDRGDFTALTRRINGGETHLQQRIEARDEALRALS